MFRKEHVLNCLAILLMGFITLSEVSSLFGEAEISKEEFELKEGLKEKKSSRELVLLFAGLDLASITHFTIQFLASESSDWSHGSFQMSYRRGALFILFCCLKIPFA